MKKLFLLAAVCALFCACNRNSDGCCPTQTCAKPACCPAPKPCCPAPKPCCPAPKPCCPAPKPCCPNGAPTNGAMMNDQQNPDWQLTAKVKEAIMADNNLSSSARFVSVSTMNGVVTLTGTVPTEKDSRMIERKVKNISGVRSVDNQLMIGS